MLDYVKTHGGSVPAGLKSWQADVLFPEQDACAGVGDGGEGGGGGAGGDEADGAGGE